MKNHREHFGATEMAPTGSSPVDGHEKITENIWARPDLRRDRDFGATEMALTGPSPVDGHEKITENIWATGSSLLDGHEKNTQRTFWRDRDGTDRIVAGRWS